MSIASQPLPFASNDIPWSDRQHAIFDWFSTPGDIRALIIEAFAGTGKTTTIIEAINRAPETRILMSAFGKKIAVELQERISNPNAEAATWHSIGFRAVRLYWENVKVADTRDRNVPSRADSLTHRVIPTAPDPIERLVSKLHTQAREMLPHATAGSELASLAIAFDCVPDQDWLADGFDLAFVCDAAVKAMVIAASEKPMNGIDFPDMLFLPLRNGWLRPRYDLVVVDEWQDLNATQLEMARKVLVPGGRIAVVGDTHQAIYGFRGADTDNIIQLKKGLGKVMELGLTVTRRCGKAVVAEAQKYVKGFTAAEDAPEGLVRKTTIERMMQEAAPSDFVLSRTNAPLVKVALALIRAGRRTRIEGRDIGAGLRGLVRKLSTGRAAGSLPEFLRKLKVWELKEAARAEDAGVQSKVDYVHDQAETLRALADGVAAVREIETRIESLFGEGPVGSFIICSSIHRAKGLEANRVFLLVDTLNPPVNCECGHRHTDGGRGNCSRCNCDDYRPSKKAQQEEANIAYVGITRAKNELVYVNGK